MGLPARQPNPKQVGHWRWFGLLPREGAVAAPRSRFRRDDVELRRRLSAGGRSRRRGRDVIGALETDEAEAAVFCEEVLRKSNEHNAAWKSVDRSIGSQEDENTKKTNVLQLKCKLENALHGVLGQIISTKSGCKHNTI